MQSLVELIKAELCAKTDPEVLSSVGFQNELYVKDECS